MTATGATTDTGDDATDITTTAAADHTNAAVRSGRSLRWGGFFGLAASAAFLGTGLLTSVNGAIEPPDGATDMGRFLTDVAAAPLGFVLYALFGIALCALYVPMSRAVTHLLQARRAARLGTTSVITGLAILVPAYVLAAAGTVGLLSARDAGADTDDLFRAYELSSTAGDVFFGLGSLLSLGLGPFLWGLAGRATGTIPRWTSTLAIVVGVLGLVWVIPPSEHPIQTLVVLANVLGSLILLVALSLRLFPRRLTGTDRNRTLGAG